MISYEYGIHYLHFRKLNRFFITKISEFTRNSYADLFSVFAYLCFNSLSFSIATITTGASNDIYMPNIDCC